MRGAVYAKANLFIFISTIILLVLLRSHDLEHLTLLSAGKDAEKSCR
jgi:hypothetical protein